MGWQGRMRGTKAERLWAKMPTEVMAYVTYTKGEDWYTVQVTWLDRATDLYCEMDAERRTGGAP